MNRPLFTKVPLVARAVSLRYLNLIPLLLVSVSVCLFSCKNEPVEKDEYHPVESITVTDDTKNNPVAKGHTLDLSPGILIFPEYADNKQLHFSLDEASKAFASITGEGLVTGIELGTIQVHIVSDDNPDVTADFEMEVVDVAQKDLNPALWTVESTIVYSTGVGYVADGTTGKPEDMFDDNWGTFFSLAKPGKTYGNCTTPEGYPLGFIVDMQHPCRFNSFRWNHRTGSVYVYMCVWAVTVEGSNDGEKWDTIVTDQPIPGTFEVSAINQDASMSWRFRYDIALPGTFEYRYVKVIYTKWSDNSGGSTSGGILQVAEFGLSLF